MEELYLIVTATVFTLDTIPVFLVPELPGRRDIYIHHVMIVGMAIWCIIKAQGFPFVMFAGLQEASNLSYLAKVYFKKTVKMRFAAQLIHVAIFVFFRFIVQISFLVIALVYLQVPMCYELLCIAMDVAFLTIFMLSIRWCYMDLRRLRELWQIMRKGDYVGINVEQSTPDKEPCNPYIAVIAFLLAVILLMMAVAIILVLHFLSKPLYPNDH